jgi:hypothetical protein
MMFFVYLRCQHCLEEVKGMHQGQLEAGQTGVQAVVGWDGQWQMLRARDTLRLKMQQ